MSEKLLDSVRNNLATFTLAIMCISLIFTAAQVVSYLKAEERARQSTSELDVMSYTHDGVEYIVARAGDGIFIMKHKDAE